MNRQEANALLTAIALGDNRTTDDDAVEYWYGLLRDIQIRDAMEAVEAHRRESTEWLQPAHIRQAVKAKRHLRLVTSNVIHEPNAADSVEQDRARRLALVRQAADGQLQPQPLRLALAAPENPATVPDSVAARAEAFRAFQRLLDIPCPFCHAASGERCRVGKSTKPGFMHPARREAAPSKEPSGDV